MARLKVSTDFEVEKSVGALYTGSVVKRFLTDLH